MNTIEVIPPKFDLHGFYEAKLNDMLRANLPDNQKLPTLKALINQAYQQGKHDARIVTKDKTKWMNN